MKLEDIETPAFKYKYPARYKFAMNEEFTFESGDNLSAKDLTHLMRCLEDGRIKIIPVPKQAHKSAFKNWLNSNDNKKQTKAIITLLSIITILLSALFIKSFF